MPERSAVRRVLMTADAVGGVYTYALSLAEALGSHGLEVVLATMGPAPSEAQIAAARTLRNVELVSAPFALEWMDDPWSDVARAGDWLLGLSERYRVDLVHLNGYAHGALPFAMPKLVVAHSCVLSWFRAVKGAEAPPSYATYREAVGRGLRAADAVVAPTRAMLDEVARHYGPHPRARVIPNAARWSAIRIAPKERLVLSAGRLWDEAKNVAALARAASVLPWPVYVAGSARHPDGSERTPEGVVSLGWLSEGDLRAWMARASIFALPARYEPFGLSPLEAALEGCALVLGDIPSLREVWGEHALFVPPDDDAALERALRRLIDEPERQRDLAHGARRHAMTFSQKRFAQRYLDLYAALVPPSPPRPRAPRADNDPEFLPCA